MNNLVGTVWEHHKNKRRYMIDAVAEDRDNIDSKIVVYWCITGNAGRDAARDYYRPAREFFEKFTRVES